VGDHRFVSLLRTVGEAIGLGIDFGAASLEALAWVALTVESSIYLPGSLTATDTGIRFELGNPPLRIGAFSGVRLLLNGLPVPAAQVRLRSGPGHPWRRASEIDVGRPLELDAGDHTVIEADCAPELRQMPLTVRLEFQNVAIPPLVWIEIRDTPRPGAET
jgi:hypothetical protein